MLRWSLLFVCCAVICAGAEPASENLLPAGDFSAIVAPGKVLPPGWEVSPYALRSHVSLERGEKGTFLKVTSPDRPVALYAAVRLPVKPEWKRIQLVAKMAAPELKPGPETWNNARVSVAFLDATGKTIGYGSALELKAPVPEFREIRVENSIPPGSAVILLQAGLFKAQGIVLLKSLQVFQLGGE
jgi:glycoside hydrolase family 2 sugar binding